MISQPFSLLSFVRTFCISVGNNRTIKCIPAHNIISSLVVNNALLPSIMSRQRLIMVIIICLNCHDCERKPIHRCYVLLLPMCQRSKKWLMTCFPSSAHFLPHSSLIHLAIETCRSEINDLIIMPVAKRYVMASLKAINSMLVLLPA